MMLPVSSFQRSATALLHRHAAAEGEDEPAEVEPAELLVVQQRVEQRVEPREDVEGMRLQLLDEAGQVARVGDQDVLRALLHAHQRVHRQRVDMVERQRADEDHALRPLALDEGAVEPGRVLRDIGEHVAVKQRGALRYAGRAAGVLQEGDVVGADIDRPESRLRPGLQRVVETGVAGQRPGRHHFLDSSHHQVDDDALGAQQVAHRGHDHVPDGGVLDDRVQRGGEILQDDDRLGAGILELVLELARRVERVDVDHDIARAQHRHHGDRDTAARWAS